VAAERPARGSAARRKSVDSTRRTKKPNREKDVILAAADVFWRKGYRAASIQDVAEKVGVLKGSLYYYIDSKEDLLWRIIDDVHRQSSEILEQVRVLDVSPIERIRIYIERHVEWYLSNVREVSVFFRDWRHVSGERLKTVKSRRRGYDQIVRGLIADARASGSVPSDLDEAYFSSFILAAVNAVPDWYGLSGTRGRSAQEIAAAYADMTVGVLAGTRPQLQTADRSAA
jgi:AcrR family transcriptional regulator